MKKIGWITLATGIFLFLILFYLQTTRFYPRCPNQPYIFIESLNKTIANDEEARLGLIDSLTRRNPNFNASDIEIIGLEQNEVLVRDDNQSESVKTAWVFDKVDLAIDSKGNIYFKLGCF